MSIPYLVEIFACCNSDKMSIRAHLCAINQCCGYPHLLFACCSIPDFDNTTRFDCNELCTVSTVKNRVDGGFGGDNTVGFGCNRLSCHIPHQDLLMADGYQCFALGTKHKDSFCLTIP